MLAKAEARFSLDGVLPADMLRALATTTTRSTEGFRRKRTNDQYKQLVTQYLQQLQAGSRQDAVPNPTNEDGPSGDTTQDEVQTIEVDTVIETNPYLDDYKKVINENMDFYTSIYDRRHELNIDTEHTAIDALTKSCFQRWFAWDGNPNPKKVGKKCQVDISQMNRRQKKSHMRHLTQTFYERDRYRCGKAILDDTLITEDTISMESKKTFWKSIFEKTSTYSGEASPVVGETEWSLVAPISFLEVQSAKKKLKATAPGPDGITVEQLKQVPNHQLRLLFIAFQASKHTPCWLRDGVVTLVPKTVKPASAAEYRPITVTSTVLRMYHGIMAQRMQRLPITDRQKAYLPRDGLAENLWIIRNLIDNAKKNYKPLYMVFVDVAKAFDSVNHEALFACCRRAGMPEELLTYLQECYKEGVVRLKGDKEPIQQNSGVRQGDPPSGPLFNLIIDWCFSKLDGEVGYKLLHMLVQFLLFADDAIVCAETKEGLQLQLNTLVAEFGKCGLALNPKKCKSVAIIASAKEKITAVDKEPFLWAHGELIPAMKVTDNYRYLGLELGYEGFDITSTTTQLMTRLQRLSKSALRPQQRMAVLREQVVPGLMHQLVLGDNSKKTLRNMDITIRRNIRAWLHLPPDVPTPMFHARAQDGGLQIPSLVLRIPRLRRDRLIKMSSGNDQLVKTLLTDRYSHKRFSDLTQTTTHHGRTIDSAMTEASALRAALTETVDGRNLVESLQENPSPTGWLLDPTMKISGRDFVKAVHVRLNCMKTPSRSSRGNNRNTSNLCRFDRQVANNNHISQACQVTHGLRVKRHDEIVNMIASSYKKKGFTVKVEPRIPANNTFLKPDLVMTKCNVTWVLDPIISADNADLERRRADKVLIYDTPAVERFIREGKDTDHLICVDGLVFTNRGTICKRSMGVLRSVIPRTYLNYIVLRILLLTWRIINTYQSRAV